MQYIPCNSALLAQENTVFDPKRHFFAKDLQKVRKSRQNSVCSGLKFSSESKLFSGCQPCSRATSTTMSSLTSAIFCFMVYVSGESEAPVQTAPNLALRWLTSLIPLLVISTLVLQSLRDALGSKSRFIDTMAHPLPPYFIFSSFLLEIQCMEKAHIQLHYL